MLSALLVLNLIAALVASGAAIVALIRPSALSGSIQISEGEGFYVQMYAARALPFGLLTGLLPFWFGASSASSWVLFTAAAIQILDILIVLPRREPGRIVGPAIGAIIHIVTALFLLHPH
ncbi:hypothetical protein Q0M94_28120 (plasmid) [Deinococcus radiomollis]|uniref:hypothetical protein n=1 Tax=Deinococcus radiomollis TaxID=468916 RepID=UPI003891266B